MKVINFLILFFIILNIAIVMFSDPLNKQLLLALFILAFLNAIRKKN